MKRLHGTLLTFLVCRLISICHMSEYQFKDFASMTCRNFWLWNGDHRLSTKLYANVFFKPILIFVIVCFSKSCLTSQTFKKNAWSYKYNKSSYDQIHITVHWKIDNSRGRHLRSCGGYYICLIQHIVCYRILFIYTIYSVLLNISKLCIPFWYDLCLFTWFFAFVSIVY